MTAEEAAEYYRATGIRVIRPLKPKTLQRIARGVMRFVVNAAQPFLVVNTSGHAPQSLDEPMATVTTGGHHALVTPYMVSVQNASSSGIHDAGKPFPTITSWPKGGGHALVSAFLAKHYGGVTGQSLHEPMGTVTSVDHHGLVSAFLSKYHGAKGNESLAKPMTEPVPTLDTSNRHGLVSTHLVQLRGTARDGRSLQLPAPTMTSGGNHVGLIAAFLQAYYTSGSGTTGRSLLEPAPTITVNDRLSLVIVLIAGEPYYIADIGMRMLQPHELLRAQFGEYADGWVMLGSKAAQVAGIGNSVCPHVSKAICDANVRIRRIQKEDAA